MASASSTSSIDDLVFWCGDGPDTVLSESTGDGDAFEVGDNNNLSDDDPRQAESANDIGKGKGREETESTHRKSLYVELCEEMMDKVLEHESFLFSKEELEVFQAYRSLSYNAQFILSRLLVRKDKWLPLSSIMYVQEVGENGARDAIAEICSRRFGSSSPSDDENIIVEEGTVQDRREIIDLTLDDDDDDEEIPDGGKMYMMEDVEGQDADDESREEDEPLTTFALDDSSASITDLLSCLKIDELREIGKKMKLSKTNLNRAELTKALLKASVTQFTLHGFFRAPVLSGYSTTSSKRGGNSKTQDTVLRTFVKQALVKCVRILPNIRALFQRLHIVYFRATEHPSSDLLFRSALLVRFRKRTYAPYVFRRTHNVFRSREALLRYEEALRCEKEVAEGMEGMGVSYAGSNSSLRGRAGAGAKKKKGKKEEVKVVEGQTTPGVGLGQRWTTPAKTSDKENAGTPKVGGGVAQQAAPRRVLRDSASVDPGSLEDQVPGEDAEGESEEKPVESEKVRAARRVVGVLEGVIPRWKELVRTEGEREGREKGLERFEEGWVLTRIVSKGLEAYRTIQDFKAEVHLLEELLHQRRWRRGKRGLWYERCALVLMFHLVKKDSPEDEKKAYREKAMDVVIRGLEDRDTHIVHRPALEKRLTRLERLLKIRAEDRHVCAGSLRSTVKVTFEGVRIRESDRAPSVAHNGGQSSITSHIEIKTPSRTNSDASDLIKDGVMGRKAMGKSVWAGREGEEVNVETFALQQYEAEGFRGFHSEGRIITTIFGLLFWDIIFSTIPGAFETPFQSAPLDIGEGFYHAREDAIEKRLKEVADGQAAEILAAVDDQFRETGALCFGVRWDMFEKLDLVEIVQCMPAKGLSVICRLLCEDYSARASGVPDLLVWKHSTTEFKFVEVKGPGDTLQENQKIWIDVFLRHDVPVELCSIVEKGQKPEEVKGRKRAAKSAKAPKRASRKPTPHGVIEIESDDDADRYIESESEREDREQTYEEPAERPPKKRRVSG